MGKRKFFYLFLVLFLIGSLAGGLYLLRQQQILRSKAAPATTLNLSATNTTPTKDQTFVVNVDIDTGANTVIGTELYILFDRTKLRADSIQAGPFFPNPQVAGENLDNTAGQISYTIYIPTGATPRTGTGVVASITFTAIDTGSSAISFKQPETIVGGTNEGGRNVLISANQTSVTVQSVGGSSPTPTPSPQPVGANTPTPTTVAGGATNTPTPTGTGTGARLTPTPTIVGGGSGGAAATLTPTRASGSGGTGGGTASGSGTQLPNTASPQQTALGILAGILLIVTSIFVKFRRLI